jgi:spermidine/putrescine transport system permease protein
MTPGSAAARTSQPATPHLQVWYGDLISGRKLTLRGGGLVFCASAWLIVFLLVPSVVLLALAFAQRSPYGEVVWNFTLENFKRLLGYGLGGWTGDNLRILLRSVWLALISTVLSLLLAYPLAFFIAARPRRTRYLWLALVIIPFCTNLVVRTYALMLILARLSPLAQQLGLVEPGMPLYPGSFAVYLGMVTSCLPFATLPLYTNVERLDWEVVEAAQDLYAGRWKIFWHAILPQTLPGLMAAIILTFIPALGAFVVPDLLGGGKVMYLGNQIQQQFSASRDWPFGAAVSFGLMLLTLIGLFALRGKKSTHVM